MAADGLAAHYQVLEELGRKLNLPRTPSWIDPLETDRSPPPSQVEALE